MKIRRGVPSEAVKQGHKLFVEGQHQDGIDVTVLRALVPSLTVEPLGKSLSIHSAADALHPFHPSYWFIRDRDDLDDAFVEGTWAGFPDPERKNLIVWRRKELENYFLEPTWLILSQYLKPKFTQMRVEELLVENARRRLYLEAANRTLLSARNQIKRSSGGLLKESLTRGLKRAEVLECLLSSPQLKALREVTGVALNEQTLSAVFDGEVSLLSGDAEPLTWGQGRWRELMAGKPLFNDLFNRCFDFPKSATRAEQLRLFAQDLLEHHQADMPDDFRALKAMLEAGTQRSHT